MKTNMTDKDKRLLVGMFIFVIIVAIGYWGVIPQIKAYSELGEKIEKEEAAQKINKMKIVNASLIEMQVEEYMNKLDAVKEDFYQMLTSAEVDRMFTEMALNKNLNIYELKFNMPQSPTDRMAYVYSALNQRQLEQIAEYEEMQKMAALNENSSSSSKKQDDGTTETSDEDSGKSASSNESETTKDLTSSMMGMEEGTYSPNTEVYAVPISITVGGEVKDLEAFLDGINNLDKCSLVTGYSWGKYRTVVKRDVNGNIISTGDAAVTATGEGVTTDELQTDTKIRKSLTVRLEIYMLDTSSLEQPAEEAAVENGE